MLRERLPDLPGVRVVVEPSRHYTQGALVPTSSASSAASTRRSTPTWRRTAISSTTTSARPASSRPTRPSCAASPASARSRPTPPAARSASSTRKRPSPAATSCSRSTSSCSARRRSSCARAWAAPERRRRRHGRAHRRDALARLRADLRQQHLHRRGRREGACSSCSTTPASRCSTTPSPSSTRPGRTFKQITGLAALQEGVAYASTQITSLGVLYVENEFDPNIEVPLPRLGCARAR